MKLGLSIVALLVAGVMLCNFAGSPASAAVKKEKKPAAPPPTYDDDVKPFLSNYCSDCHSGGKAKGGYNMDSVASLLKAGKKGPAVVAGKPAMSRIILAMAGKGGAKPMPPKDKPQPKPDEAKKVWAWIQAGAKETADAPPDDAKKADADDKSEENPEKPAKGKTKPKAK